MMIKEEPLFRPMDRSPLPAVRLQTTIVAAPCIAIFFYDIITPP